MQVAQDIQGSVMGWVGENQDDLTVAGMSLKVIVEDFIETNVAYDIPRANGAL
jgi:hypothetical protein